jgi:glycerate-2-kinase
MNSSFSLLRMIRRADDIRPIRESWMNAGARRFLKSLFQAALDAVEPEAAVRRALRAPPVAGMLARARRVGVFAVGKAAAAMLRGMDGRFEPALVVLPRGHADDGVGRAEVLFASHP